MNLCLQFVHFRGTFALLCKIVDCPVIFIVSPCQRKLVFVLLPWDQGGVCLYYRVISFFNFYTFNCISYFILFHIWFNFIFHFIFIRDNPKCPSLTRTRCACVRVERLIHEICHASSCNSSWDDLCCRKLCLPDKLRPWAQLACVWTALWPRLCDPARAFVESRSHLCPPVRQALQLNGK